MRFAFRADASLQIGNGHIMRCLALADALCKRGGDCTFVCRPHSGNLIDLISKRGYQVLSLPSLGEFQSFEPNYSSYADLLATSWSNDAIETRQVLEETMGLGRLDWLIVDHYALDRQWETTFRSSVRRIMVIDDLLNRPHDCDVFLNQNLSLGSTNIYKFLNKNTVKLIGPKYALLRPEFAALRPHSLRRRIENPAFKHLMITMGGVDRDNITQDLLEILKLCSLPKDLRITVVMGPHAPWLRQIYEISTKMPNPTEVLVGIDNMAQLMLNCDLAIGAAGSTSWERACLGLPTIQIILADNQISIANSLDAIGAALTLERRQIAEKLPELIIVASSEDNLLSMTKISSSITQGRGAEIIANILNESNENHFTLQ